MSAFPKPFRVIPAFGSESVFRERFTRRTTGYLARCTSSSYAILKDQSKPFLHIFLMIRALLPSFLFIQTKKATKNPGFIFVET